MKTITTINEVRAQIQQWQNDGDTIGFVPTMGFLHEGHQSLMAAARQHNDRVVVSIFVNPLQFGPQEDFTRYPRDLAHDQEICHRAGVDLIFHPSEKEMYPAGFDTYVEAHGVTARLEGITRPTHFRGVTTVVTKLFNIVTPDDAFFGQKDAQQVAVIRQLVRDLNMPVTIHPCPIIREADGLAKSSRNVYLAPHERAAALSLSRSLSIAKRLLNTGEQSPSAITAAIREAFSPYSVAKVDYIKLVDPVTLKDLPVVVDEVLILLAVYIGKTRLIDNILLKLEDGQWN